MKYWPAVGVINSYRRMTTLNTAGIIIIGDEILKGHTKDTNSSFLLGRLWSLGVKVRKVVVVADDIDAISEEVKKFSAKYSMVFTSGGIGPTHDDVTMAAISKAFDEDLVRNEEMAAILKELCKSSEITPGVAKMAVMPKSANLTFGTDQESENQLRFPMVSVRNVHVFPGVPEYLEKSFTTLDDMFKADNIKFFHYKIYVNLEETDITETLNVTDERFKDDVHLGSYPVLNNNTYKVKLTLESEREEVLSEAFNFLLNKLPSEAVVSIKKYLPNSREAYDEVVRPAPKRMRINSASSDAIASGKELEKLLSSNDFTHLSSAVKCAWSVITEALRQYTLDEICICFNGGKDCTVLLHLWLNAIWKHCKYSTEKPIALYIQNDAPFEEAETFIREATREYDLDLIVINGHIKEALSKLKTDRPSIKACLMGTRHGDPFSEKLRAFSPTDSNYPTFMRVNPLLDWTYTEIWDYLRTLEIPYCSLYDEGYTSLGSSKNTVPNPFLLNDDGSYSPAYMLSDGTKERSGRT